MIILTDFQSKISQDNSTYSKLLVVISFHSGKKLEATHSRFVKCVEKVLAWSNEKEKKLHRVFKYDCTKVDYEGRGGQPQWHGDSHIITKILVQKDDTNFQKNTL